MDLRDFYGYGDFVQNKSPFSKWESEFPYPCGLSKEQKLHFLGRVFYEMKLIVIPKGGQTFRLGRGGTSLTMPFEKTSSDGSGGSTFTVSPRHRYAYIALSRAVSKSVCQEAYAKALKNWKKPIPKKLPKEVCDAQSIALLENEQVWFRESLTKHLSTFHLMSVMQNMEWKMKNSSTPFSLTKESLSFLTQYTLVLC